MRFRRTEVAIGLAAVALAGGVAMGAEELLPTKPRILFIGLWDRAFQQMSEASVATGVAVQMRGITTEDTPLTVASALEKLDYTGFDLIYVLQIDQTEAHALAGLLKDAKKAKPALRVVQLDRRTTQQELLDEGILEVDPQVIAYWRGFGLENLKRLLVYSHVKYLGEPGEVPPPVPVAAFGFYHPDASGLFTSWTEYSAWYGSRAGYDPESNLVAIFIQQDYVIYGNHRVYDTLIRALESRGISVAPMFGSTLDLQPLLRECRPALLMLQHHHGPEDTPEPGKKPFLEELGVPYLYSAGMMSGITIEEWQDDIRGIRRGGYGQLARHELYGIIEPFLIGARGSSAYGFALDEPIPDRVERVADRVKGWLKLRNTPVDKKKIAIVYFHKYLGKADIGRPAPEMSRYMDPHESLVKLLEAMSKAGYQIHPRPASSEELLDWMRKGGRNIPTWAPGEMEVLLKEGKPVLLPETQYVEWYGRKLSSSARGVVEEAHGPPPGEFMVVEQGGVKYIVLPCIQLGNIVLGPQPNRGGIQDMELLHSRTEPPPHNYLAFYWWLQEQFRADALIHFGTHGSEFYLPGKEIFLSSDCFPDTIIGNLPNFDVWTIQNVGEAVIAKRRSYSVIVDHGVPPILAVSRDAEAEAILELIDRLHGATAPPMRVAIQRELADRLRGSSFLPELELTLEEGDVLSDSRIDDVANYLQHVNTNNVVQGMHVVGQPPSPERALPFIVHIVARNTDLERKLKAAGVDRDADEKARRLFEALFVKGLGVADAAREAGLAEQLVAKELEPEILLARQVWEGLNRTGDEITNLLAGLEGKYVPPGPGGDPILRPDALPTGRNLYGLSPLEIPTRQAWEMARQMTDEFLAKSKAEHGRHPEKLAFSMTGMETFRDMGVMEAQILYLIGVQPEWSPGRLISGLKLIPREELGRPRIDVVMSVNAIYMKDFPSTARLLDEAVRMAGACDEPDNAIRQHALSVEKDLLATGVPTDRAALLCMARMFGSPPGGGSARLVWFLPRSGMWQGREEIVELWRTMRTHVYTGDIWGEKLPELHDKVYAGTEGVVTNWSDNLLSPLTNHHYPEETGGLAISVQWITGKPTDVSVFDLRRRDRAGAIRLDEVLSLELRSVALNKAWIQGQMEHGYIGATQFMQIVDQVFQWEAVREGAIWPGAWEKLVDVYVRDTLDLGVRGWFDRANPFAFQELTATLLEAARKGFWSADPATVREVALAHANSVARYGHGAGPYSGGNERLRGLVTDTLNRPEDVELTKLYLAKVNSVEKVDPKARLDVPNTVAEQASNAHTEVAGQKIEPVTEDTAHPTPVGTADNEWLVYSIVGLAVLALFVIGFRFRMGAPSGK